jgi:hypothetical protein
MDRAQQLGQAADPRLQTLRLPAVIDGQGDNRTTILARADRLRQMSEHKTGMAMQLDVTVGTPVMVTHNINVARGVANGSLGTVVGYAWARGDQSDRLTIIPEDATPVHALRAPRLKVQNPLDLHALLVYLPNSRFPPFEGLPPKVWPVFRRDYHSSDLNFTDASLSGIAIKQFPVVLAYAITGHKSQGLTLAKVTVGSYESTSAQWRYVVHSRVRCLDNLSLLALPSARQLRARFDPAVTAHLAVLATQATNTRNSLAAALRLHQPD